MAPQAEETMTQHKNEEDFLLPDPSPEEHLSNEIMSVMGFYSPTSNFDLVISMSALSKCIERLMCRCPEVEAEKRYYILSSVISALEKTADELLKEGQQNHDGDNHEAA